MQKKIVIAHRGACGYLPEHSQQAKVLAHSWGVDYLEQDVVLTKDGIPIIIHDIYLEDITDVAMKFPNIKRQDNHFYAIDLTLEQIKSLRVYERFNPANKKAIFPNRFPTFIGDFSISTLQEEIELIQGLNKSSGKNVGLYTEIKQVDFHKSHGHDITKIVLKTLAKYGYKTKDDNFYIQCFDFNEIKRMVDKLKFTGSLTMLLEDGSRLPFLQDSQSTDYNYLMSKDGIEELKKYVDAIGPHYSSLLNGFNWPYGTSDLVAYAKDAKLKIHTYTLRKEETPNGFSSIVDFGSFLYHKVGIDGIFSDFGDLTLLSKDSICN